MDQRTWKLAGKLYLRTLLAGVTAFFVFICLELIFTAVFSRHVGFSVDAAYADGRREHIGDYATTNPDDVYDALKELGYDTTEVGENKVTLFLQEKKEMPPAAEVVSRVVSQLCMGLIFLSMIYTLMWDCGDKERNSMQPDHVVADPRYGWKVGWRAAIPSGIAFLVLLVGKLTPLFPGFVPYYRYAHFAFYPLYLAVVPNGIVQTAQLEAWRLLPLFGLVLLLPIASALSYWLGYRGISLSERLMYRRPKKGPSQKGR